MLEGTCHCGAVRVTVPRQPRTVTDCNCSICRRYGVLWAYYKARTVRVTAKPKATRAYAWGRKQLRFVHCATCGCVVCWQLIKPRPNGYTGINIRNFDPEVLRKARIKPLDAAAWPV